MRLLRTLAVVLACGLTTIGMALAASAPRRVRMAAAAQNTFAAGVLAQTNSRAGSAILTAAAMRPGDRVQGSVTITNSGDLAGSFTLAAGGLVDVPGPNGGHLADRLLLDVSDVSDPSAPIAIASGPLSAVLLRDLGSFAAGVAHTYRFVVTFPDGGVPASATSGDNAYLGSSATLRFDWTATAPQPPVVTPTPTPMPAAGLTFTISPRHKLSLRRPVLRVRCSRACSVKISGSIIARKGRAQRVLVRLRTRIYRVRGGVTRTIRVTVSRATRRKIVAARAAHKVVTLRVKVVASGPAGPAGRVVRTLRLRVQR